MIGYKIVRRVGDKTVSAFMRNDDCNFISPYEVEYKPGEIAKPILKGSKLFAFGTLDNVAQFLKDGVVEGIPIGILETWEAELQNPMPKKTRSIYIDNNHVEEYWKPYEETMRSGCYKVVFLIVTDSLICDSVTLLKRIDV